MNSGGTLGGGERFILGFALAAVSFYFFLDSVHVHTGGGGWISGAMRGGGRGNRLWETTSMGIVFLPFFLGVVALFYNAKIKWGWYLTWLGLAVIAIEIFSRIRFLLDMKVSHLLIMVVTFAAGTGLMLQSYREDRNAKSKDK
ncbi:MAG: hypothetical protein AAGJ79_07820 [Verrucomicrobiota bacterium]